MSDKTFFDTNILCYAYDRNEPEKRKVCEPLVENVFNGETIGVISNQILGELFYALVKRLGVPVSEAEIIVEALIVSERWEKINYTETTMKRTIKDFNRFKIPFWDLVIAETIKENNLEEIITENEKDFRKIEWLRTINPFK